MGDRHASLAMTPGLSISLLSVNNKKAESAGGREGIIPTTPDVGEDSTTRSISESYGIVKRDYSIFPGNGDDAEDVRAFCLA